MGLFDTRPDRREIRFAILVVGLQAAAFLAILPFRDIRLPEIPAFVPVMDAITFVGELIIGALLYAQAAVFRSRALTVLASGYVFGTLLVIPHALTFPGAFSERGLLGAGLSTTGWIALFWWWALPLSVIAYVFVARSEASGAQAERPLPHIRVGLLAAVVLAALATLLARSGDDVLPSLYIDRSVSSSFLVFFDLISIVLPLVAIVLLFLRRPSVLEMWLVVVLAGYVIQSLLNVAIGSRFSFGWYANFGAILVSNIIVMLVLLTESTQLYARLALSAAAKDRDREARLMSMDAVAAAMAHEVGQPLAAVALNASAGLSCLDRTPPNMEGVNAALREVLDASDRTFAIIKSVRAMYSRDGGLPGEVRLDQLLRETVSLFQRELIAQKITVRLELGDKLPLIYVNRVQLQRVLVNLLTNAIEAVVTVDPSRRVIIVRAACADDREVRIEVSDTGPGFAAKQVLDIFEPFFTTKSTGMGLGLPLSRAIIEEHGGRLWATSDDSFGATIHLTLPCGGVSRH